MITPSSLPRSSARQIFVTLHLRRPDTGDVRHYRVVLHERGTSDPQFDVLTVEYGEGADALDQPRWFPVRELAEVSFVLASLAARYTPVWELAAPKPTLVVPISFNDEGARVFGTTSVGPIVNGDKDAP